MRGIFVAAALSVATSAAATPADEVAKLAWIAGSWTETRGAVTTRETWLAPLDGGMAGASQTNRPGRAPSIEHVRIVAGPTTATYTAAVDGQPPTPFVLKRASDSEAVFENLAHDFPQRIIYRRCGDDLCARIEGTVNGRLQAQDWRYKRER
ncbi:DUF6265 family protein [Phenylobacterium sp.]|jgi:hypothetical protein|uniref:DUF6265 family protein n=1 Tax=Phenylobacterium sp. TaxID=1871053 RepID=UPI002F92EC0E